VNAPPKKRQVDQAAFKRAQIGLASARGAESQGALLILALLTLLVVPLAALFLASARPLLARQLGVCRGGGGALRLQHASPSQL